MKQAVIDIGSNSLRLTLYAVDEGLLCFPGRPFCLLF